jgi:hypothetical protein
MHFPIALKHVDRTPAEWYYETDKKQVVTENIPIQETWQAMEELVDAGLVKVRLRFDLIWFSFHNDYNSYSFFSLSLEYWYIKFLWSFNYRTK